MLTDKQTYFENYHYQNNFDQENNINRTFTVLLFYLALLLILHLLLFLSSDLNQSHFINPEISDLLTTLYKKMKFFIMGFFSKCDEIRSKLHIWSHLLKKLLMENVIFCTVLIVFVLSLCQLFRL